MSLSYFVTDYSHFCEDTIVPSKMVCCFQNNKWINKEIKGLLNRKKRAFTAKDNDELPAIQQMLKRKQRGRVQLQEECKVKMGQNSLKEVWYRMKRMTGYSRPASGIQGGSKFINELNLFFYSSIGLTLPPGQLAAVFQHFFNLTLRLKKVLKPWSSSCIVPVPKKGCRSTGVQDCQATPWVSGWLLAKSTEGLKDSVRAGIGVVDSGQTGSGLAGSGQEGCRLTNQSLIAWSARRDAG